MDRGVSAKISVFSSDPNVTHIRAELSPFAFRLREQDKIAGQTGNGLSRKRRKRNG